MTIKSKFKKSKIEYDNIPVPDYGKENLQNCIDKAKSDKKRKINYIRNACSIAASIIIILCIVPNVSQTAAAALQTIPVIGDLFKVVTVREYNFDNGKKSAKIKQPKVESEKGKNDAVDYINKSVEQYTEDALKKFKQDIKENEDGYQYLDISYDVITNNDKWFTLEVSTLTIQADSDVKKYFYNIDKTTGEFQNLKDLFKKDSNYVQVISDEIKKQMINQMKEDDGKAYWLNDNQIPEDEWFNRIDENQSFYINNQGNLVIAFNKFDVAPGVMGTPEFTIPNEVIKKILK